MGSDSIIEQIYSFISELFRSVSNGYLFFGSAWDFIRYAVDIILVAVLFYWTIRFLRQTRAWQLVKGAVLILVFVGLCGLLGLEMVNFLVNKLLYVLAILFIVIFQPELRRALETVGLKSFGSFKNIIGGTAQTDNTATSTLVHEIITACDEMSKTYTGALILIERTTRLDELLTQENVVKFDSSVTSSVLQSIFYKGSPMHDGGLLVRDGRIVAARCHVPLSVTMHNLERTGTRHRAAVGASELGDTIAVVVSEERGTSAIAVSGRLYEMKNAKELEANLSYLLGVNSDVKVRGLGKIIKVMKKKSSKEEVKVKPTTVTERNGEDSVKATPIKTKEAIELASKENITVAQNLGMILLSLVLSMGIWMYIQVNSNPVVTKNFTVQISYDAANMQMPENMEVSYPIKEVTVELVGRRSTIESISAGDIIATIDYSHVTGEGVTELPVVVTSADDSIYFRVRQQVPETISVTVYSSNED
ncbi:MAG: diadenylate cyclase [Saccharofermentans sp.]|nr:diadenylate cyclase [Saccharofermentans sp.]